MGIVLVNSLRIVVNSIMFKLFVFGVLEWRMQSIDLLNPSFVMFCAGESGVICHL